MAVGSLRLELASSATVLDRGAPEYLRSIDMCRELSDGQVPEWIELVPGGANIEGRDGRKFKNPSPDDIIAAFQNNAAPLPIDVEHSSAIKAPQGEPAPAAGWIVEMEVRGEGAIWARVEWTEAGALSIRKREYRFISPGFLRDTNGVIREIIHAGLTNQPNFRLTSLNREGTPNPEGKPMDPKLLKLLGLEEGATIEEICAAVTTLKATITTNTAAIEKHGAELEVARSKNMPSLELYVPRSDHDKVVTDLATARAEITKTTETAFASRVTTAIEAALKAGKITPATKDFYLSTCHNEDGLKAFEKFSGAAPDIVPPSGIEGTPVPGGTGGSGGRPETLTQAEINHAKKGGFSEKEFLESKQNLWDSEQNRRNEGATV